MIIGTRKSGVHIARLMVLCPFSVVTSGAWLLPRWVRIRLLSGVEVLESARHRS